MEQSDFSEFIEALTELAELFRCELSETQIRMYCKALADVPLNGLITAINESARFCKFFPLPAELREKAWIALPPPACKHNRGRVPVGFNDDGSKIWQCSHCSERI